MNQFSKSVIATTAFVTAAEQRHELSLVAFSGRRKEKLAESTSKAYDWVTAGATLLTSGHAVETHLIVA